MANKQVYMNLDSNALQIIVQGFIQYGGGGGGVLKWAGFTFLGGVGFYKGWLPPIGGDWGNAPEKHVFFPPLRFFC